MSTPYLSKSRYLNGLQCPRLLWYHYNAKDRIPAFDERTRARFSRGHEVGDLAKRLFPGGIDVAWDLPLPAVLVQTRHLLAERRPLFEAGFAGGGGYARVDVLDPAGGGAWDIVEVKMGASVKPVNCRDVAFQRYCCEAAGLQIRRCFLMHVNTGYVRDGAIDPAKLLVKEDVTDAVAEHAGGVAADVRDMLETIAARQCPETDIGPHCDDPHACVMKDTCWKHVRSRENNIFTLRRFRRDAAWDLYRRGVPTNDRIPGDVPLTAAQRIQIAAERTGAPHIDTGRVREFLERLRYPVCCMDFETFGYDLPVPLIDGASPYGNVPFQFSVHVVRSPGAAPVHRSFLWDGAGDPLAPFMEHLVKAVPGEGSILVYNKGFEIQRLRECAALLPACADWVAAAEGRIADLLDVFGNCAVYFPSQHGSASLKAVLPAVTGAGYEDMAIADGQQAADEFIRVTFGDAGAADRAAVRDRLVAYCALDTRGPADIVARLGEMIAT